MNFSLILFKCSLIIQLIYCYYFNLFIYNIINGYKIDYLIKEANVLLSLMILNYFLFT